MKLWIVRYEVQRATIAKIANSTTCGSRYSFPSARLGSSISVSRSTNELNAAMATPARLDRLPAKESHGTALQESLRRYPMAVCASVWHFGLTRSKNRALNSPARAGELRYCLK